MLELGHPKTPHIFAAARQLDVILAYLKQISHSDSQGRLFMMDVIRPCFVALRWLNVHHFGQSPKIAAHIDALEQEAEKLARLGDGRLAQGDGEFPTRCPVCNKALTITGQRRFGLMKRLTGVPEHEERYCWDCLRPAMQAYWRVQSVEDGFATQAI
jgi:hypothetical protein